MYRTLAVITLSVVVIGGIFLSYEGPTNPIKPLPFNGNRCEIIAKEGITVTEAKNIYDQECSETHPLWNCKAVEIKNGSEFRWECYGFRRDLAPKQQPYWDVAPSQIGLDE